MKKDKILLQISELTAIKDYEKLGISSFLFPLVGYSVGYKSFTFEEIKDTNVQAYVLVNRLLTDEDIDEFIKLEIPKNVRGFIIEDTGLYTELKDRGYTLINFQNHLNANFETVNFWLEYYDSLVISTDITEDEIDTIISKARKPLILNTFCYPMIMYSRRSLISNYYENFALDTKKEVSLKDPKGEFEFVLRETEYGTACFDSHILDARKTAQKIEDDKVLFYLIDTSYIEKDIVIKAIEGEKIEGVTRGFLDKKTVYRIGDLK